MEGERSGSGLLLPWRFAGQCWNDPHRADLLRNFVLRRALLCELHAVSLRWVAMAAGMGFLFGLAFLAPLAGIVEQVSPMGGPRDLLTFFLLRELGPWAAALLLTVRLGSSGFFELALLKANGQIEALGALGISEYSYLACPRIVAAAVGGIALTCYFCVAAALGASLGGFFWQTSIPAGNVIGLLLHSIGPGDILTAVVKPMLFGTVIATVLCSGGLAGGSALGDVPATSARFVGYAVGMCVAVEAWFLVLYFAV